MNFEAAIIANLGLQMHRVASCSTGSPWGKAFFHRMNNPQPGDFVVVGMAPNGEPDTLVGWLEALEDKPLYGPDEWDDGGPSPTEPCYVLKLLDGREFRWVNVAVYALPLSQLPTHKVIADPKSLIEQDATLEEEINSFFSRPYNDCTPETLL